MRNIRKYSLASVAASLLLLFGCDSEQSGNQEAAISGNELTLPMPDRIRSINALDPNSITATAIVNGVPVILQRNSNGGFIGDIQVPTQSTFLVNIEFSEQFAGQNLVLATSSQQVTTGNSNQQLNLRRSTYNFGSHDSDGDSVSNIVEREEDTDPFDSTQAPSMINVGVVARQPEALQSGNFDQFFFEASVGSDAKVLSASGSDFRSNFFVVDRAPVNVSVQMIETFTGDQLAIATQTRELNTIADQQTVIFEGDAYSTTDTDDDGQSDLAELIAGTDLTSPDNTTTPTNSLTAQFAVPAVMQNAQSIYAEFRIDNQLITNVPRSEDSFTATTNSIPGSIVVLDVTFLDNFNNTPYVLGTAQMTVVVSSGAQTISFIDSDFLLDQDTDNDGTANYLERLAGTDPFNPPVVVVPPDPVSCSVSAIPTATGLPGESVTLENISSFIDCGADSFAVNASEFNFNWNQSADNISWVVPADSAAGSSFEYQIDVVNPFLATEIYASAAVLTEVEASECALVSPERLEVSADVFLQNDRVFNVNQLRVNETSRLALIRFENVTVPSQDGLLAARLIVRVGGDSGSGVIGVYQDDTVQWSESDDEIDFSDLTNLVGSSDEDWETNVTYTIGLTSLFISGTEVNLFLQQDAGGNDVSFTSRETGFPAVLELDYCLDEA